MADLLQSARIFEASARLEEASTCLRTWSSQQVPSGRQRDCLAWAGNFLSQLDKTSGVAQSTSVNYGLAVQATTARPSFYNSLIRVAHLFQAAGLRDTSSISDYLRRLYAFLSGSPSTVPPSLSPQELLLGAILLHELSHSLLLKLSGNGVASNPAALVAELHPA